MKSMEMSSYTASEGYGSLFNSHQGLLPMWLGLAQMVHDLQ